MKVDEIHISFYQIFKLIICIFGGPRDMSRVTLGNTKAQECGRQRVLG